MSTHLFRAGWVLPVTSPPVREGGIAVRGGRILEVGPFEEVRGRHPRAGVSELGTSIVLPGLVNAHTHLSLGSMRGKFPAPTPYSDALSGITRRAGALSTEEVEEAVRSGIEETWRLGTSAVGEITTRPEGASVLAGDGRLAARIYFEFLGVTAERARRRFEDAQRRALHPPAAEGVRTGLSPHAPYSVWPGLWEETASVCREHGLRWSTHFAESPGEDAFLRDGAGPLRRHLESLGVWDGTFPVPGRPLLDVWEETGVLDARALLVHGVHLTPRDAERIAKHNAHLCLCPRSNAHLDLPPPPVEELHAARVSLCLGTDSLATNRDLGLWGELRALHRLAPRVAPSTLLRLATWNGACALGLEDRVGSLGRGRRADFLAVGRTGAPVADPVRVLLEEGVEETIRRPVEAVAPLPPPG